MEQRAEYQAEGEQRPANEVKQVSCLPPARGGCGHPWQGWKGIGGTVWAGGVMLTGTVKATCPHCGRVREIRSRVSGGTDVS